MTGLATISSSSIFLGQRPMINSDSQSALSSLSWRHQHASHRFPFTSGLLQRLFTSPRFVYKVNFFSFSKPSLLEAERVGPMDTQLTAIQGDGNQKANTWSQQDGVYVASCQCFLLPPWSIQMLLWALSRDRCVPPVPPVPLLRQCSLRQGLVTATAHECGGTRPWL